MNSSILYTLQLNVVFLLMISFLITRLPVVQKILTGKKESLWDRAALILLFSGISICSTYIGINVDGMIVNTRVIGVLAAGLFGGPAAGIGAGAFATLHRVFYDPDGFSTMACALSTLIAGFLGAFLHDMYTRTGYRNLFVILIAAGAETLHMLLILLLSPPFELARSVVSRTALPMICLNSFGLMIFMFVFNQVCVQRDRDSAVRVCEALKIADSALPFMRQGLARGESLDKVVEIILRSGICDGVLFTDRQAVLACGSTEGSFSIAAGDALPQFAERLMRRGGFDADVIVEESERAAYQFSRQQQIIAASLMVRKKTMGCMILIVKKKLFSPEFDAHFAEGLSNLFSTQLELAEMDELKRQYRAAELKALRSQINPHFLYNALNTISCVCREQPERARQLLLTLATYYRHTLSNARAYMTLREEIECIGNYLVLEKARFEEKLIVEYCLECSMDQLIPAFILQPIVENAVKYGADTQGVRHVSLRAADDGDYLVVTISDRGQGFPQHILDGFAGAPYPQQHFGLLNVDRRLKNIYGPACGLKLHSSPQGACVEVRCAKAQNREFIEENMSCA